MYRDDEITFIDNLIAMINTELTDGRVAEYKETAKNNGIMKRGVMIKRPKENIGAVYYLGELYNEYLDSGSYNSVFCSFMKNYYRNSVYPNFDINEYLDFDIAKNRIVYRLVNYDKNEELLDKVPHERIFDLAMTYHYVFDMGLEGAGSILINDEHMKLWGVDKRLLYKYASKNTPRILEAALFDIVDLIGENPMFDKMPVSCTGMMYVLCNVKKNYGAGCILYPHVLSDFAKRIDGDFYIIPSSVHEVILLPAMENMSSTHLLEMISCVNETTLLAEDVLSNNAYYYEKDSEQLTMITE